MSDTLADLFRRRLQRRTGPHGFNVAYMGLYTRASRSLSDWLVAKGSPKDLCGAITAGLPVLETALSEVTADSLDLARWTMRNRLSDVRDEDLLIVLERVGQKAPRHHVVLASGPAWECPYCHRGHLEWTVEQLRRAIAFLRDEDGTASGTG